MTHTKRLFAASALVLASLSAVAAVVGDNFNLPEIDNTRWSAPESYRFSNPAANPAFTSMLRSTFDTVAALPCDILISPHPVASRLWYRLGDAPSEPLVDATACRRYAEAGARRLDARLDTERQATP